LLLSRLLGLRLSLLFRLVLDFHLGALLGLLLSLLLNLLLYLSLDLLLGVDVRYLGFEPLNPLLGTANPIEHLPHPSPHPSRELLPGLAFPVLPKLRV